MSWLGISLVRSGCQHDRLIAGVGVDGCMLTGMSRSVVFWTRSGYREFGNCYARKTNIQAFSPHNLAPFSLLAFLSLSRSRRLRIFPEGLLGTTSINSIPPLSHL